MSVDISKLIDADLLNEFYQGLDEFTSSVTQSNGKVVFDNLNPSYGYKICFDTENATGNLSVPHFTNIAKATGTTSGTIKLTYTIVGGTNGTSKFKLRIFK